MMHLVKPAVKPPNGGPSQLSGKRLIVGLLGVIAVVAAVIFWIGMSGGSTHVAPSKPGIGFTTDDSGSGSAAAAAPGAEAWDGAAINKTISDPRVREALRKRILAGWAEEGPPEQAAAAKAGRFIPAPASNGERMDPKYIQEVVRGDFFPMARKCYEELLTRKDAASGRVEMSFTIVADEKHGGIVEDAGVDSDGGVADEKMDTCMRESLSTLAFRPPAHGGYVTVVYPIVFAPGDDEPEAHDR